MNKSGVIPSLFTLGNLLCGFGAIAVVANAPGGPWDREFILASWLILVAMVFDMFDGKIARLTNQTSDWGGQLDSLCDVVSFGVAPGLIVYVITFRVFHFPVTFSLLLSCSYVAATALRLARFNVGNSQQEESHHFFLGLPSPAAAGAIVSLVLLNQHLVQSHHLMGFNRHPASLALEILPFIALAAAALMVSSFPYVHVTSLFFKKRKPPELLLIAVVFISFAILQTELTLFCVFGGYMATGVIASAKRLFSEEPTVIVEDQEDEEAIF